MRSISFNCAARRLVEAEAAGRRALELRPAYAGGHYFIIAIALLLRRASLKPL